MAAADDRGERRIALAAVAGAHGVKGELRLKLFSDSIESLSRHQKLYVAGAERRVLAIRDSGRDPVARFEGVDDRSAAEALRGSLVEIDRSPAVLYKVADDTKHPRDMRRTTVIEEAAA